jgi:hypothetical protein
VGQRRGEERDILRLFGPGYEVLDAHRSPIVYATHDMVYPYSISLYQLK